MKWLYQTLFLVLWAVITVLVDQHEWQPHAESWSALWLLSIAVLGVNAHYFAKLFSTKQRWTAEIKKVLGVHLALAFVAFLAYWAWGARAVPAPLLYVWGSSLALGMSIQLAFRLR